MAVGFNSYTNADVITTGTALSAGVAINNIDVIGLLMSPAWDAASLTINQSLDGITWNEMYDQSGNPLTITTAAARYIVFPPAALPGVGWLRLRSGTVGVPVNQTANRTLTWFLRNYGR